MESTTSPSSNLALQDLQTLRDRLIAVAKEAGTIILSANPTPLTTSSKKNTADIVTQTDKAVESLIRTNLASHYPSFAFIGEETYHPGQTITDDPTFIVDPIDGTSNFVHGFPDVAVSIALVVEKLPTVGVVYNPFRDELWAAIKGHGVYHTTQSNSNNGNTTKQQQLLSPKSPLQGLSPACIAIDFGTDRQGPNFALNLKVFTTLLRTASDGGRFVNSLRCSGSAALAICRVAASQQDAFWECGSWAWDVAAAWCVLVEAGGVMVDGHPGGWNPPVDNRRYLAVRPATAGQREFVEEFWDVIGDDRSTYGPP
ncbi:uncharacterized protein TRIVIDRAFT_68873 [Trichoderma virens Gv29-8]|uniref:Inositol-1-monophosphatase n=1 Tax=Hypocrea virens (strain Gv29-8 / FGSC 10586) TaxID=413071 RepID=G9MZ08_HYPVG|nr:uncharacterized protein TRIVIDRAFT_68873 [Trichoderma virens Gv29-8]EHK20337.1 hypothetical protein TRIVIDRAFT_68873 [Trichoderma virens Gv29-8]